MSDKEKSLDNFEQDKTNTNDVKGGFGSRHAKPMQDREGDGLTRNPRPIVDPKKPIKRHDQKQGNRGFEK